MSTQVEPRLSSEAKTPHSGGARRVVRKIAIAPIRFYQVAISPYRNRTCRYYPSCSQYAVTAVSRHGIFKGTYLAVWRLLRCNPWTPGGVDNVPERAARR